MDSFSTCMINKSIWGCSLNTYPACLTLTIRLPEQLDQLHVVQHPGAVDETRLKAICNDLAEWCGQPETFSLRCLYPEVKTICLLF